LVLPVAGIRVAGYGALDRFSIPRVRPGRHKPKRAHREKSIMELPSLKAAFQNARRL